MSRVRARDGVRSARRAIGPVLFACVVLFACAEPAPPAAPSSAAPALVPLAPVAPVAPPAPPVLPPPLPAPVAGGPCVGVPSPMWIVGGAPYAELRIGASSGRFLVDFGTTSSTIDLGAMTPGPPTPHPMPRSPMVFDGGYFLRPLPFLAMTPTSHSGMAGEVRQAGILGMDQLGSGLFLLDWAAGTIARAETPCDESSLRALGLVPVPALPTSGHARVPTVPIVIGGVSIPTQVDTGFADHVVPRSINVNRAAYDALVAAGVRLTAAPDLDLDLTTCVRGTMEHVTAYRLGPRATAHFVDAEGEHVREIESPALFVKSAPEAARTCGGVGTWDEPGAQLGVSILVDGGRAAFDFAGGVVWLPVGSAR